MSGVPVWRLFAYMDDDPDGDKDERRRLSDWQVEDALRWCRFRGFDHIYLARESVTTHFEKTDPVPGVVHHNVLQLQPRSSRGYPQPKETGRGPSAA